MRKIFEFRCNDCGHYEEKLVRDLSEAPECPNAHGQMEKIISASSFHFANGAGTDMGKLWAVRGQRVGSAD